ncbi:MAG: sensor histidine kinase [Planctomycetota bacterium]|jgi:two-component system NtrC family sensor kinase
MASPQIRSGRSTPIERQLESVQAELDSIEQQLGHAQRLASIGTLAAGVAHEINNVLTPVLSYAHIARGRPDDSELQAKAYDKIIAGVESACEIVQAVLNFAKDREEEAAADVGAVLEGALRCLARDPEKDGITLATDVPPDSIVRIRPLALQQVLLNLLLNATAVLRTARGGSISIRASQTGDGHVRIDVSDNGPGIPEDVAARIFEPFVSTKEQDGAGSGARGGAGLGLMVSRRLIEHAGGTIAVDTEPGQGATFTLVLPAGAVEA